MRLKGGCGCIVVLALICAVMTIGIILGGLWFYRSTLEELDSEPQPLTVPDISEFTEQQIETIRNKLKLMIEDGEAGALTITDELLNGYLRLSTNTNEQFIGMHSWISFNGERTKIDLALPLDPYVDGKFFNGTAVISGEARSHRLRIRLHSLIMDGPVADKFNWALRYLEGRDIVELLNLEEVIPSKFLKRCTAAIKASTLRIECEALAAKDTIIDGGVSKEKDLLPLATH